MPLYPPSPILNPGFVVTVNPAVSGNTSTMGAANRTVFMRCQNAGTITKVGYQVGVQSGNIAVAAYSNTGTGRTAAPGARLASSGSVACPAVGYAETSLGATVVLAAGDWLAIAADNITATFGAAGNLGVTNLMAGLVANQDTSAFPPPSTAVIAGYGTRSFCLVGVP